MTINDKFLLFKSHPAARGLDDNAVREISDAAELVRCQPGDVIQPANQVVNSIYLIVHGRLRVTALDPHGRIVLERYHGAGGQFGGLSATLAEPTPVDCVAEDPGTLLRLDYAKAFELTKKHDAFRLNMTRLLAGGIREMIFGNKLPNRPRMLAFFHQSAETRKISRLLFDRLIQLGETPCVLTDLSDPQPVAGVEYLAIRQGGQLMPPQETRRQITQWLDDGDTRIIADLQASIDRQRAASALEACEHVLWCVTPDNWEASMGPLQELESAAPGWRDKITIIWLLKANDVAPLACELRRLAREDIKISFDEPGPHQSRVLQNGFERLVHLFRGVKIGVALGGGAARGMAHLGVLKALEESGIVVDMIAGTSAGAMSGTVYARGIEMDYAAGRFVNDLTPSWWFRHLPRGDQWYLLYKYRRGHFDPMLRKYIGDYGLEQLPLAMNSVTVDLISGNAVVRDRGDAVRGIVESINLPVLSVPINHHGQSLVDGGLINNIPADVLVAGGCNFVIAVSVTGEMEVEFAGNRPDTPTEHMRPASTIQTILRSQLVQSRNLNALGVQPADIVIEPDVTGFELTAFTRTDELSAVGEQTTRQAMPQIRASLHRLDSRLFAAPEEPANGLHA